MSIETGQQTDWEKTGRPVEPSSGIGCLWKGLGCGCLGALVIAVIFGVVSYIALSRAWDGFVEPYLADAPVELPLIAPPAAEAVTSIDTFMLFLADAATDTPAAPLTLAEEQLNGILYHFPNINDMGQHMVLRMDSGELTLEGSLPLGQLTGGWIADRFLNGTAVFRVPDVSPPELFLTDVRLNEQELPKEIVDELGKESLIDPAVLYDATSGNMETITFTFTDPEIAQQPSAQFMQSNGVDYRDIFRGIERIEVTPGMITFVPLVKSDEPAASPEASPEEAPAEEEAPTEAPEAPEDTTDSPAE